MLLVHKRFLFLCRYAQCLIFKYISYTYGLGKCCIVSSCVHVCLCVFLFIIFQHTFHLIFAENRARSLWRWTRDRDSEIAPRRFPDRWGKSWLNFWRRGKDVTAAIAHATAIRNLSPLCFVGYQICIKESCKPTKRKNLCQIFVKMQLGFKSYAKRTCTNRNICSSRNLGNLLKFVFCHKKVVFGFLRFKFVLFWTKAPQRVSDRATLGLRLVCPGLGPSVTSSTIHVRS